MIKSLKEFKKNLLSGNKIVLPVVFSYKDVNSLFLLETYVNKVCENNSLNKIVVNNVSEIENIEQDVFSDLHNLYVIYSKDDFSDFSLIQKYDVIIIKEYDEKEIDKYNIPTYVFDKINNSYIEEYLSVLVPGLSAERIKYLCEIAQYDIHRLNNEALKLNIFDKSIHNQLFDAINKEGGYSDLSSMSIFDFVDGVIKKDYLKLHSIYDKIKYIDIEGTGLTTILLRQFKNMIDARMTSADHLNALKMSPKQISYIRNCLNKYSNKDLIGVYRFLTNLDYELKSGDLDMKNEELITYITSVVLDGGLA